MNVKPLHDHVIVLRCGEDTTTEGGIVLPAASKDSKPEQGIVIAVGPGRLSGTRFVEGPSGGPVEAVAMREPMSVQEGDHILFGKFNGPTIKIGRHEYLVMRDSDIYGVLQAPQEA